MSTDREVVITVTPDEHARVDHHEPTAPFRDFDLHFRTKLGVDFFVTTTNGECRFSSSLFRGALSIHDAVIRVFVPRVNEDGIQYRWLYGTTWPKVSAFSSDKGCCVPVYSLRPDGTLGLSATLKVNGGGEMLRLGQITGRTVSFSATPRLKPIEQIPPNYLRYSVRTEFGSLAPVSVLQLSQTARETPPPNSFVFWETSLAKALVLCGATLDTYLDKDAGDPLCVEVLRQTLGSLTWSIAYATDVSPIRAPRAKHDEKFASDDEDYEIDEFTSAFSTMYPNHAAADCEDYSRLLLEMFAQLLACGRNPEAPRFMLQLIATANLFTPTIADMCVADSMTTNTGQMDLHNTFVLLPRDVVQDCTSGARRNSVLKRKELKPVFIDGVVWIQDYNASDSVEETRGLLRLVENAGVVPWLRASRVRMTTETACSIFYKFVLHLYVAMRAEQRQLPTLAVVTNEGRVGLGARAFVESVLNGSLTCREIDDGYHSIFYQELKKLLPRARDLEPFAPVGSHQESSLATTPVSRVLHLSFNRAHCQTNAQLSLIKTNVRQFLHRNGLEEVGSCSGSVVADLDYWVLNVRPTAVQTAVGRGELTNFIMRKRPVGSSGEIKWHDLKPYGFRVAVSDAPAMRSVILEYPADIASDMEDMAFIFARPRNLERSPGEFRSMFVIHFETTCLLCGINYIHETDTYHSFTRYIKSTDAVLWDPAWQSCLQIDATPGKRRRP